MNNLSIICRDAQRPNHIENMQYLRIIHFQFPFLNL